jgi:flavin reductase (DIM6/NTAB) family NADH-FMN oxidoreductase RutF
VTTRLDGRDNGLISLSAGCGGIIPEAMRVLISLTKHNLTHDMVMDSGVFAIHLLSADAVLLDKSLAIIRELGGKSGRDGDKIGQFATKQGVTGSPILLDALSYVEGRVVGTLDATENTTFLADLVAAEILHRATSSVSGTPGPTSRTTGWRRSRCGPRARSTARARCAVCRREGRRTS